MWTITFDYLVYCFAFDLENDNPFALCLFMKNIVMLLKSYLFTINEQI